MVTQDRDSAAKQSEMVEGAATNGKDLDPMGLWLRICWAIGVFVYGWLALAVLTGFDYSWTAEKCDTFCRLEKVTPNVSITWISFIILLIIIAVLPAWWVWKKSLQFSAAQGTFLAKIFKSLLPIFFCFSALAVLVLTLMTYNGQWADARQGVATIFASLFAAVGVVVSMIVSYRNGEETRNLESQRQEKESQRHKDNRAMEARKQDADLIKTLNDRLHEIVSHRQGGDEGKRVASYYQLAALYKDWDNLAESSPLVEKQRANQQKYILKLFFGVVKNGDKSENGRTDWENQTINSIIPDIFPAWSEENNDIEPETIFDLEGADLRKLNFSGRDFRKSVLKSAHLEGAKLWAAHLEDANLWEAHLENADLNNANLEDAGLMFAHLEGANLTNANLDKANLILVNLKGTKFHQPYLDETLDKGTKARWRVVAQLSAAEYLSAKRLLEANGFNQELVDEIMEAHRKSEEELYK